MIFVALVIIVAAIALGLTVHPLFWLLLLLLLFFAFAR